MIKQATLELAQEIKEGVRDFNHRGQINTQVMIHPQTGAELVLLNYNHLCLFENRWNSFEQASRGLVVREDGTILCLPFDKFFNYGQSTDSGNKVYLPESPIVEVWEKMDGSLLNVWWDGFDWRCSTRGSFESEQAQIGQTFIDRMGLQDLPTTYTYMFEIIYPDNRIVVDYGDFEGLSLLGARALTTGDYARSETLFTMKRWFFDYSFVRMPQLYTDFESVDEILELLPTLDPNNEGFVCLTANDERYKMKGKSYLIAHKILTGLSEKSVLEQLQLGTYEDYVGQLPDEFRHEVNSIGNQLKIAYNKIMAQVDEAFAIADQAPSRKEFAAIAVRYPFRNLLFLKLDGRLNDEAVWKYIEKKLK